VATGEFDLLDMVVLLCFIRPIQALFAEGQEHGRTIPLAVTRARPADPSRRGGSENLASAWKPS
jgi:hypothetical protein